MVCAATTINVLALADEVSPALYDHFQRERWKSIDLVLSCGDLPPEYLDFICSQLNVPVVYVRGNHDAGFRQSSYDGLLNAHGRIVEAAGLRIAGFAGSIRYSQEGCQFTESEMRHLVLRVRCQSLLHGIPQIVLAHAPPAGIHEGTDLAHRGFESLRRAIDLWRPHVFVHGHVHVHYGREVETAVGGTRVINAFPYRVFQVPATFAAGHRHGHLLLRRHVR